MKKKAFNNVNINDTEKITIKIKIPLNCDTMNSLKLKVELNELYTLKKFVEQNYKKDIEIRLAIEEIFVNIVKHSNADYIIVNIEYDNDLTIEFIDNGIKFDPTTYEKPNKPKTLEEIEIGSFGILLIKNYVDDITYKYENEENHLRIIKKVDNGEK